MKNTNKTSLKVNFGSGLKRYPEYINVDADILCKPDYLCDIGKDKFPFNDNTVENAICFHILEHLEGDKFFHFIKELYRVCNDGAIIQIEIPCHRHDEFYGDPSHYRAFTVETFRLFSKKYNQWHIEHFGSSTGFGLKCDVDFEIVEYQNVIDDRFLPILNKMESEEEKELFCISTWNVIKYLRIVWQVIK